MANLFLTHPFVFLTCFALLAFLVRATTVSALQRIDDFVLARRHSERVAAWKLAEESDEPYLNPYDRQEIATTLLASWTRPTYNANGEKLQETVEPVLVADAFRCADLIISMRAKSPLDIIAACSPGEMPTFSEIAAATGAARPYPSSEAGN